MLPLHCFSGFVLPLFSLRLFRDYERVGLLRQSFTFLGPWHRIFVRNEDRQRVFAGFQRIQRRFDRELQPGLMSGLSRPCRITFDLDETV